MIYQPGEYYRPLGADPVRYSLATLDRYRVEDASRGRMHCAVNYEYDHKLQCEDSSRHLLTKEWNGKDQRRMEARRKLLNTRKGMKTIFGKAAERVRPPYACEGNIFYGEPKTRMSWAVVEPPPPLTEQQLRKGLDSRGSSTAGSSALSDGSRASRLRRTASESGSISTLASSFSSRPGSRDECARCPHCHRRSVSAHGTRSRPDRAQLEKLVRHKAESVASETLSAAGGEAKERSAEGKRTATKNLATASVG